MDASKIFEISLPIEIEMTKLGVGLSKVLHNFFNFGSKGMPMSKVEVPLQILSLLTM